MSQLQVLHIAGADTLEPTAGQWQLLQALQAFTALNTLKARELSHLTQQGVAGICKISSLTGLAIHFNSDANVQLDLSVMTGL